MTQGLVFILLPLFFCALAWLAQTATCVSTRSRRNNELELKIDALLPQTQCGQCDYDACLPYARAIAANQADINRCPPGGRETVTRIASLLGRDERPLHAGQARYPETRVAVIEEKWCIGCVKCIRACPVDAIVGAPGQMHTVIDSLCTGCELCLPPCPVDCITLRPVQASSQRWIRTKPGTGTGMTA